MVPLTAAVIVTTPQKLAFIDVAKGVRMFSKLKVAISIQHPYLGCMPRQLISSCGDMDTVTKKERRPNDTLSNI